MSKMKRFAEYKHCPACRFRLKTNYIPAIKHWYCVNCDTEFDGNNYIYVYNEMGDLVEVI
ncbi:hypothetical protein [Ammoniphilus resinae]|uniref:Ribosomal protein L37AE/L43A n=1 Tax=Ammoniphilus resinae TaxID=861532 RepID=A0ABS4GLG9_9BACL|nr:hypothetical protein [Ammoniphilus resinae]MBP1931118.1 ribosomal protein L37AE/L43A [Ammoniphilus resinae]